ncbi:hypothetical protein JCM3775_000109, partial [Rhodotorula graminis]
TNPGEAYASRPLATELHVDIDDYDAYDVPDPQVVTFALREFKSIITLADSVPAALTAHFSTGGRPLMLQLVGDYFEVKFVVATTDYDSGGGSSTSASGSRAATASGSGAARGGAGAGSGASGRGASAAPVKREKSESLPFARVPLRDSARAGAGAGGAHRPLFNPPTPSPAPDARAAPAPVVGDDDDEYGGGMDADALGFDDVDALFAEVDQVSQVHLMASQSQREPSEAPPHDDGRRAAALLVSDSTAAGADENDAEAAQWARTTQLGPTQGGARAAGAAGAGGGPSVDEREREAKRARWNLMGDS